MGQFTKPVMGVFDDGGELVGLLKGDWKTQFQLPDVIPWTSNGDGAVPRNVGAKLREVKNLEDFGAVPIDVIPGYDSRAAILLAIYYAREFGARIEVNPRCYFSNGNIVIGSGGALSLVGKTGPRNTPVDVERTSTFKFPAGSSGIVLAHEDGNALPSIHLENLMIYKPAVDTKGSGTIGLKVMGLKYSTLRNIAINGFDQNFYIDANNGSDAEPNLVTIEGLRSFQAGTYTAHIRAVADVTFAGCIFGGDAGALDSLVQISDGEFGGVADAVHFDRCFFIPSPGQTTPFGVRNQSSQAFWLTFSRCVFEGASVAGVLTNKGVSTYDSGDRVTLMMEGCWLNMPPLSVPVIAINTSISLKNSRLYADGLNTPCVKLDATALVKFNTTISGNSMFANNGALVEGYKQDGVIVTGNVLGMTGATPSVKAFHFGGSANLVLDANRDHTNTNSTIDAPGTVGTWGGYTALNGDGPLVKNIRSVGAADGSGVYSFLHAEAVGNKRVGGYCATYRGASGEAKAMVLDYVDGTNARFTGATAGARVNVVMWFTEEAAVGWA